MGEALTRAAEIPFLDLGRVNAPHAAALREASERVLASGRYVLGPEVEAFENEFAEHLGGFLGLACAFCQILASW